MKGVTKTGEHLLRCMYNNLYVHDEPTVWFNPLADGETLKNYFVI